MHNHSTIYLTALKPGESGVILSLEGGHCFQERLRILGVKEKKKFRVVAIHPFRGPVVIEIDDRQISIGRGMASKILVERCG
jgi:ferrous iron transport protein A